MPYQPPSTNPPWPPTAPQPAPGLDFQNSALSVWPSPWVANPAGTTSFQNAAVAPWPPPPPANFPNTFPGYPDLVAIGDYFQLTFNGPAWAALTPAQQAVARAEAAKWLDTLCYHGQVCVAGQPNKWPRQIEASDCCHAVSCNETPPELLMAISELALALHQNQTAIIAGAATAGQAGTFVSKQKLGDLEVNYDQFTATAVQPSTKVSSKAPLVLQRFPWLVDMLHCLLSTPTGANRIIPVLRN